MVTKVTPRIPHAPSFMAKLVMKRRWWRRTPLSILQDDGLDEEDRSYSRLSRPCTSEVWYRVQLHPLGLVYVVCGNAEVERPSLLHILDAPCLVYCN